MNDCMMTIVLCPYEEAGCNFYDERSNLKAHIDASREEHLSKTWSKLLKTTERVNELEQVKLHMQTDIDTVKKSLEEAKEDVAQLKLSEAERKLENLKLKKDVLELQMKLKDSHHNVNLPRKQDFDRCIKIEELSCSDTEEDLTDEKTTKSSKATKYYLSKPVVGRSKSNVIPKLNPKGAARKVSSRN